MREIVRIIETTKEFKKEAIEILGVEQSFFTIEEFHGLFDAVILTATVGEFRSIESVLENIRPVTFNQNDSTIYYTSEITTPKKTYKILIPFPYAIGIEAAAALATKVISTYRPKYIFMSGICAGNKNVTKIGDIIVAEKSLNLHGIVTLEKGDTSPDKKFMHNVSSINGHIKNKLELFSTSSAIKLIKKSYPNKTKFDTELKCHVGLLVSGSSLMRSSKTMEEINSTYLGVKGLDMETYGLYYASTQVFKDYAPNFVSIKSVSDFGDDSTHKISTADRKEYALFTSSHALRSFISDYLE